MKLTLLGMALFVTACAPHDNRPPAVQQVAVAPAAAPVVAVAATDDTAQRAAYLQHIHLDHVRVSPRKTTDLGNVVVVDGEVTNVGTRAVNEVEVTVYFLDQHGDRFFEKRYHPVVAASMFTAGGPPLRPHYARTFGAGFDDVPTGWGGKAEVKVTDVKFVE